MYTNKCIPLNGLEESQLNRILNHKRYELLPSDASNLFEKVYRHNCHLRQQPYVNGECAPCPAGELFDPRTGKCLPLDTLQPQDVRAMIESTPYGYTHLDSSAYLTKKNQFNKYGAGGKATFYRNVMEPKTIRKKRTDDPEEEECKEKEWCWNPSAKTKCTKLNSQKQVRDPKSGRC